MIHKPRYSTPRHSRFPRLGVASKHKQPDKASRFSSLALSGCATSPLKWRINCFQVEEVSVTVGRSENTAEGPCCLGFLRKNSFASRKTVVPLVPEHGTKVTRPVTFQHDHKDSLCFRNSVDWIVHSRLLSVLSPLEFNPDAGRKTWLAVARNPVGGIHLGFLEARDHARATVLLAVSL